MPAEMDKIIILLRLATITLSTATKLQTGLVL